MSRLGKDALNDLLKFCDEELEVSTVLEIEIDHNLNFEDHIKTICTKAAKKLHALQRIANFIDYSQRNLLFQSIIKSQFSYCPIAWMFCSRRANNLINSVHERALKVIYDDQYISFTQLLSIKDDSTIH